LVDRSVGLDSRNKTPKEGFGSDSSAVFVITMTSITFDEMTTLTFDVEPSTEVKTMAFDDPIVAGLHSVIQKLTLKIVEVRDGLIRNLACLHQ
jgi:hypothetical protein